ncbi:hypothetical protein [Epibacterium sp. Ofav1-8]|uniref:hypothetical protein n=1 Tax=Epibacterium sp. Ofav1-8 TaxID=2917735 RepID=UPI003F8D7BBA
MFMIPGVNNVVRINGTGFVTADEEVRKIFTKGRHVPMTVVVVDVQEAYFQCAKALMRSALWGHGDLPEELPTAGDFIREQISDFDSEKYDAEYPDHARERMW